MLKIATNILVILTLLKGCGSTPPNWSQEKTVPLGEVIQLINIEDRSSVQIAVGSESGNNSIIMTDGSSIVPTSGTMANSIHNYRGIKVWLSDLDGTGPQGGTVFYQYDQKIWQQQ